MSTKITTTARALRELLQPVLGLADKGDSLPVLSCIRLRGHGLSTTATATDRYVCGMSRSTAIASPAGFEALLPLHSAKALLATFKVSRGHDPELELTFDGDTVHVETAGLSDAIAGARLGFRLTIGGKYPEIESVLRDAFNATGQEQSNVSGALLEQFKGAMRNGHPLRLHHNGLRKPTGIAIGHHFRGAIMPVHVVGDDAVHALSDGWGELLGAPTTATTTTATTEAVSA